METPVITDVTYKFIIKRIAEPLQFRNLWSLSVDQGNGEEMVVDADALSTVISKVGHILEVDGY